MHRIRNLFESAPIFAGLTPDELAYVRSQGKCGHYPSDHFLFQEGEKGYVLYLILQGTAVISIQEKNHSEAYYEPVKYPVNHDNTIQEVAHLSAGDVTGDLSFVDQSPRTASVKTTSRVLVFELDWRTLNQGESVALTCLRKIAANIAKININRLRKQDGLYVKYLRRDLRHEKAKSEYAKFLLLVLATFSVADVMDRLGADYQVAPGEHWFSTLYLILLVIPILIFIYSFNYHISTFGITLKNSKKSIIEGVLISAVLVFVFTSFMMLRAYILGGHVSYMIHLFDYKDLTPLWMIGYIFHSYVQEFMARGVVQSSIRRFLDDKQGMSSVCYASLLFAIFHFHHGLVVSMAAFVMSFTLGSLYIRHNNLFGVTIVHYVIGMMAMSLGLM